MKLLSSCCDLQENYSSRHYADTQTQTKKHEDPSVQNQKESLSMKSESDGQAGGLRLGPIRNGLWEKWRKIIRKQPDKLTNWQFNSFFVPSYVEGIQRIVLLFLCLSAYQMCNETTNTSQNKLEIFLKRSISLKQKSWARDSINTAQHAVLRFPHLFSHRAVDHHGAKLSLWPAEWSVSQHDLVLLAWFIFLG